MSSTTTLDGSVRYRRLRMIFAIALTISLFAGSISTGSALTGYNGEDLFFPWVPNGAMLHESGPFFGAMTIQNLESEKVTVYASPKATLGQPNPPMLFPFQIEPLGTVTFTLAELGVGADITGSGVVIQTEKESDGQPALVAGVMKQSSPVAPNNGKTGPDHVTVAGYTALGSHQIGEQVVFPIAQSNSGWDTIFRATNFSNSDAALMSIQFYEAGTGANFGGTSQVVGPGQTWTYSVLQSQIGAGWVGTAVITADQPIGAVAERVKPETSMLIMNSARLTDPGNDDLTISTAPLLLREWNHWNTGISIANLADQSNEVTVTYFNADGTVVDTDLLTLPPRGMDFIFTPANPDADEQGFVGSAVIQSEHPVYGATDQVKYLGQDDDTGHAMSYMFESTSAVSGEHLLMPLMQKGDPADGQGDTTGIQVFNPSSTPAKGEAWFYDEDGKLATSEPFPIDLDSYQGETIYAMFIQELAPGFQGSAVIHVTQGQLVGASNNVNYEVQYDGSSSYNLIRMGGLLEPYAIEAWAEPFLVRHFDTDTYVYARVIDRFGNVVNEHVSFAIGNGYFIMFDGIDHNPTRQAYYVGMRIKEESLGQRPLSLKFELYALADQLYTELEVTWEAEPVLAQSDQ